MFIWIKKVLIEKRLYIINKNVYRIAQNVVISMTVVKYHEKYTRVGNVF